MSDVLVRSLYGAKTKQPLVSLHWQDTAVQLTPAQAREMAGNLVQAAEASEQDAFLFEWSQAAVGCDEQAAARLIEAFRSWRIARERQT